MRNHSLVLLLFSNPDLKPSGTKRATQISHLGMVFKTTSGLSGGQIPQAQGLVPRAGKSVVTVGRQNNVANEVRVTVQTLLRNTVAGIVAGQLPNDQGLV